MTPEEFTARATAAVATVEPDDTSYVWLTRNVARRRTRRRAVWAAATAVTATAAVVVVAMARAAPAPPVVTSPTPSTTNPATPTSAPAHADVDGDGVADRASVFYEMSEGEVPAEGRWGIDVTLSSGGTVDLWSPTTAGFGQNVAAVVDVNQDGRAEVVVQTNVLAKGEYVVATLVGRHLEWVHHPGGESLRLRHEDGPTRLGWGCAEETATSPGWELYTVEVRTEGPRHVGTRTVYSLDVSVAVEESSLHDSWSPSIEPVPAEFQPGVRCGSFVA